MARQSTIEVLDPTATGPSDLLPLAPPVDTLRGKVLGIRRDRTWRSFTIFADVVRQEAPQRWGVRQVILFDPGVRIGTTEEERQKVAGFVRGIDAAIVGLGT
ncbi:MAG: hypothetical protein HY270_20230 [Deltaproteobacteria bacterium]|nr:hypothetical protein [Deltaproteobacteria bacterium]